MVAPMMWVAAAVGLSCCVIGIAAATSALVRRLEDARTCVRDLRELAGIAATAADLDSGVAAAEPIVLRRTGGTSMHLRWDDEMNDWATIPRRAVLALGHTGRSPVHLVIDGVADDSELTAMSDILGRLIDRAELARHAHTDPLTGVADRHYLEELMRTRDPADGRTVAMLDLDHFSRVNDDNGRDAGDELLHRFADVLTEQVRRGDDVARYDGPRFCLLVAAGPTQTSLIVDRIRTTWERSGAQTTFSAGIGTDMADADRALGQAKHDGRNRTVVAFASQELRADTAIRR